MIKKRRKFLKKTNYSLEERNKILSMFKAGYTADEIGKSIGRSKGGIQKEIQKIKKALLNLPEIEKQSKIKTIERKEAMKAINYEVNSYISSRALIDKNRNHYVTNKNGDLILKKGYYTYTSDMPRRLINSEGRKWNTMISSEKS